MSVYFALWMCRSRTLFRCLVWSIAIVLRQLYDEVQLFFRKPSEERVLHACTPELRRKKLTYQGNRLSEQRDCCWMKSMLLCVCVGLRAVKGKDSEATARNSARLPGASYVATDCFVPAPVTTARPSQLLLDFRVPHRWWWWEGEAVRGGRGFSTVSTPGLKAAALGSPST